MHSITHYQSARKQGQPQLTGVVLLFFLANKRLRRIRSAGQPISRTSIYRYSAPATTNCRALDSKRRSPRKIGVAPATYHLQNMFCNISPTFRGNKSCSETQKVLNSLAKCSAEASTEAYRTALVDAFSLTTNRQPIINQTHSIN